MAEQKPMEEAQRSEFEVAAEEVEAAVEAEEAEEETLLLPEEAWSTPQFMETLLRYPKAFFTDVAEEKWLSTFAKRLFGFSTVLLGFYGLLMGLYGGWVQSLASMIKLPLLFLATLGICLPSFYIFNLVLGSKLKFGQLVVLLLYAVCLTAVICASLAPVAFFFMICGSSYYFMVLLHVAIMTLAGLIGLGGMRGGLRFLSEKTGKIGTEKSFGFGCSFMLSLALKCHGFCDPSLAHRTCPSKFSDPSVATSSLPSLRPCGSCYSREVGNKLAVRAIKRVGNDPMGGSPVWKRNDCWKGAEKAMKGLGRKLSTDTGDWLFESHTESSGTRKRQKMQFRTLSFRSISLCEIFATNLNFALGFIASSSTVLWLACHLRLWSHWTKAEKLSWSRGLTKTQKALSLPTNGLNCWIGQFNSCLLTGEPFSF
jgi:hypothetical protein